jgi:hypothetical protein
VSIFKKDPKYISENHRPIPLTWICCKLSYGSWIYNYLCNHCLSFHHLSIEFEFWFSANTPVSATNKADLHDIAEILLKVAFNTITLFLKSLNIEDITNDWKTTQHVSIFKKGPKYISENHRPIPLTWICCKLLDHIVVSSIMTHANTYNIHYHWLSNSPLLRGMSFYHLLLGAIVVVW